MIPCCVTPIADFDVRSIWFSFFVILLTCLFLYRTKIYAATVYKNNSVDSKDDCPRYSNRQKITIPSLGRSIRAILYLGCDSNKKYFISIRTIANNMTWEEEKQYQRFERQVVKRWRTSRTMRFVGVLPLFIFVFSRHLDSRPERECGSGNAGGGIYNLKSILEYFLLTLLKNISNMLRLVVKLTSNQIADLYICQKLFCPSIKKDNNQISADVLLIGTMHSRCN